MTPHAALLEPGPKVVVVARGRPIDPRESYTQGSVGFAEAVSSQSPVLSSKSRASE
jgi:hypothetical protein